MNPNQEPTAKVRRKLEQLRDLYVGNLLTPERLLTVLGAIKDECALLDEQLRDDEHFEITLDGLSALHRGGKPVRWAGHLQVIEGDRA